MFYESVLYMNLKSDVALIFEILHRAQSAQDEFRALAVGQVDGEMQLVAVRAL